MNDNEETKKLGFVVAAIFFATSIWAMTVSYSVQAKLYGVELEKRAIQANAGLLTCGWILFFMGIFLIIGTRNQEHLKYANQHVKGKGIWIVLIVALIISIVITGLSAQIKKSECNNSQEIIIEDQDDYCKKINSKNKAIFVFSIIVIVIIVLFVAYDIYKKYSKKSGGNESFQQQKKPTVQRPHTAFGNRRRFR